MIREDLQFYVNNPEQIEMLINDYTKNEEQFDKLLVELFYDIRTIHFNTMYNDKNYPAISKLMSKIQKNTKHLIPLLEDKND